jgi:uncharacterized protein
MRKGTTVTLTLVAAVAAGVFLLASVSRGWAAASELIPLYTPPVGGTAYVLGAGIVNVTNKHLADLRFVQKSTTGTMDMVRRMSQNHAAKKPAFAIFGTPDAWNAFKGKAEYANKPLESLRAVIFVNASDMYLVVPEKSTIKSYKDVKGKKIGIGGPGSTVANGALVVLQYHGLKKSDFKPFYYTYRETIDGIRQGTLDGGFIGGGYPIAMYADLALQQHVRIVPVDEKAIEKVIRDHPYYYRTTVKAQSYKGLDHDVTTYGATTALWTLSTVSDDLVYRILKNLFEHKADYFASHKSAGDMTAEHATKGIPIPFHPGAVKYLKEIGTPK